MVENTERCASCGSTTTYVYKGRPAWHSAPGGRLQCHKCYSSKKRIVEPQPKPEVVAAPKTVDKKVKEKPKAPTPAEKLKETKAKMAALADNDFEGAQRICKSYTNYWEPRAREQKAKQAPTAQNL